MLLKLRDLYYKWSIGVAVIITIMCCIYKCWGEKNVYLKYVMEILLLLGIMALVIGGGIQIILRLKNIFHNLEHCDDELFEDIDKYRACWKSENATYIKRIQVINFNYKKGGRVDDLVKNHELERLFARMDFLSKRMGVHDDFITYGCSLMISVIATIICSEMITLNPIIEIIVSIAIALFFINVVLFKYGVRGQNGSYAYQVDEYERELLLKKVRRLEKNLKISSEDEEILKSKQNAVEELIKIRKRTKSRRKAKELEEKIHEIENLKLYLGQYKQYHIQKFEANGKTICMVYYKKKGQDQTYIGESGLANQEYVKFYLILKQYNLLLG